MSRDEIRDAVIQSLSDIAPETDPRAIDPQSSLREQLDIDSMDFLRFVTALHDVLHVDVPEKDYAKVDSIDGAVDYLAGKLG
ncbi:MAG: hypothetical protein IT378_26930 [Sandaracinaceae bacterium]|nr:hypothetical protein [Sandaracinaceae bacterium]